MGKIGASFVAACALLLCFSAFELHAAEAARRDSVKYYVKARGLFHLRTRTDVSSTNFMFTGDGSDDSFSLITETPIRLKQNIGFGVGPLFLNFGIALNGKSPDTSFGANILGKIVSFNINYSHMSSMSGKGAVTADQIVVIPAGSMNHSCLQARLLITPNGKRFSLPAALNQNTIQKRSAGSIFFCLNGTAMNTHNRENSGWPLPDLSVENVCAGAGLGYGYNWVPVERLLVHASFAGGPGIIQRSWTDVNGVKQEHKGSPSADVFGNIACIYHFPKHWYIGAFASFERIFTISSTAQYVFTQGKSDAHLALGVRF